MPSQPQETIVLVHGTFAAPSGSHRQWYEPQGGEEPAGSFIGRLHTRLQALGSPARCWAHCAGGDGGVDGDGDAASIFHWSGANDWMARSDAAHALAALLQRLVREGWRTHVVAHSHGGTVLMEALTLLGGSTGEIADWADGSLVTMGTPYLNTYSAREAAPDEAAERPQTVSRLLGLVLLGAVGAAAGWQVFGTDLMSLTAWEVALRVLPPASAFAAIGMLVLTAFGFDFKLGSLFPQSQRLLVMSSEADEAWQLLNKIAELDNPFRGPAPAAGGGPTRRLAAAAHWARNVFQQSLRIDRLLHPKRCLPLGVAWYALALALAACHLGWIDLGALRPGLAWATLAFVLLSLVALVKAPAIVAAELALPGRLLGLLAAYARSLGTLAVTAAMRAWGWAVLRRMLRGDGAYPMRLAPVSQKPVDVAPGFYTVDAVPAAALARALARRSAGLSQILAEGTAVLSQPTIGIAETEALMRRIETDLSLVHAVYYTDDDCIARIAEWIARSEAEIEALQPRLFG